MNLMNVEWERHWENEEDFVEMLFVYVPYYWGTFAPFLQVFSCVLDLHCPKFLSSVQNNGDGITDIALYTSTSASVHMK